MPKKILLADDSITIQKVVELTFSDGDYEVTAVNNGAKAVQKLSEMRPDIILSDIIMPEKNGYEVCEYVKSHPDYRNIPVVLLTGTFEPFDPDRADKAGCDAVVTKPFESQSLIHKIEELIEQSRSAAPAAAVSSETAPAPEPSPWLEEAPAEGTPAAAAPSYEPAQSYEPAGEAFTHDTDLFSAPAAPEQTTEMPFETPAPSVEPSPWEEAPAPAGTHAYPQGGYDEFPTEQQPAFAEGQERELVEPSPWDERAALVDEGREFPPMTFDERTPASAAPPSDVHTGWNVEAAPEAGSGAPESSVSEESPFAATPAAEDFSAETRAFPKMTFDELQQAGASTPPVEPAPAMQSDARPSSPWDEQPEFGSEEPAFGASGFDTPQEPVAGGSVPATPWDEPATAAPGPWGESEPPAASEQAIPSAPSFATVSSLPFTETAAPDESPFASTPLAETAPQQTAVEEPPAWSAQPAERAMAPLTRRGNGAELSDDEVDRIARRVVQLISDQVVRNIAWEIIPDLAEMVVKERIRQLESEP